MSSRTVTLVPTEIVTCGRIIEQNCAYFRHFQKDRVDLFFAISVFSFGLIFGSFLNVCIYRLPRGMSVVSPQSACPSCKKPIPLYLNVPVLSWLLLGGRCRNCKAKISPRYLVVEVLTGLLFLACFGYFGLSLASLKYAVFGFLLLGLIFTDAETFLLPDKMTLTGLGWH